MNFHWMDLKTRRPNQRYTAARVQRFLDKLSEQLSRKRYFF